MDVRRAQTEIEIVVYRMAEDRKLTRIELLQALTEAQQGLLKDMLRAERHPNDPDRAADIE